MATPAGTRLIGHLGVGDTTMIDLDVVSLAASIWHFLKNVAMIEQVYMSDLTIYKNKDGSIPQNVTECIATGTRFFDAIYYCACTTPDSVPKLEYTAGPGDNRPSLRQVEEMLLLAYVWIMIRGHYPNETGTDIGPHIPNFCSQILGFRERPILISQRLASFNIVKVPIGWVKHIDIRRFSPKIQQRVALGAPGYRMMVPFLHYEVKPTASAEAKACAAWVKNIATQPADWAIFSATRSPLIFEKLKSINKGLGNLMLECFTDEQFAEMLQPRVKLIVEKPTRDARADHWKTWTTFTTLDLHDPILQPAQVIPAP